jgi:hypothetical protein
MAARKNVYDVNEYATNCGKGGPLRKIGLCLSAPLVQSRGLETPADEKHRGCIQDLKGKLH